MRIIRNICFAFLIAGLPAVGCFAQSAASTGLAQVEENFNAYNAGILPEKLYVHTDKDAYTAGELMWFKVYAVNGIDQRPVDLSKVAYIEVLDNNQNILMQAKIALHDGLGNGSVYVPVTLPSGNYLLRAYTGWMKNFGLEHYFNKQVCIINPLKSPGKPANVTATEYDIQFFPEGGNLVNGITSIVGIKVADNQGKGIDFKGAIINKQNDTVAHFRAFKFGIGRFTFKPDKNDTYRAIVNVNGKSIQKSLPEINNTGYVMDMKDDGSGRLSVTVNTNIQQGQGTVYLFAHTRSVVTLALVAQINSSTANFTFDRNKIGGGISHLTVFNSERQPVCERLYFKRPEKKLVIEGKPDEEQYSPRKKVTISIGSQNGNGKTVEANLSMSVYRLDSLQHPGKEDIQSYLWFTSDLRGSIESPGYYFDHNDAEADEAADNLMITQGWSKFNWSDVLAGKQPVFNFLPEYNGPMINARITDQSTGKPAADKIAYLSITGKRLQMYTAASDSLGRLKFNLKNFYGSGEIIVQTNSEVDTGYKIDIQNPFSEQYAKITLPPLSITSGMQALLKRNSIYMQVQNVYSASNLRRFYDPDVDSSAFYGLPNKTYLLDNYTRFATLEEVMREYVSEVNVRNINNKFHIIIINGNTFLNESDPLVLLDGVPVFNLNKVFAIDPLKIRKLDVINNIYYYGRSVEDGIISLSTYKGDLGGVEIDPHAVIMDYEGLELQRQFYSPEYETRQAYESAFPDFRNVLYWAPDINTGTRDKSSVSFYTSDQPGKYIGVIQGLTANGEAGSRYFTFDVVN